MPDAAIFDGTKRHLGTKYEKNGTKQNRKISRDQTNRGSITCPVGSIVGILSRFVLPCFATGCHTYGFKIATSLRSSQ